MLVKRGARRLEQPERGCGFVDVVWEGTRWRCAKCRKTMSSKWEAWVRASDPKLGRVLDRRRGKI